MENNEKLLEAVNLLRTHCKQTEKFKQCIFADGSVCRGISNCGLCKIPQDWDMQGYTRWSSSDKALAAGLKANGYNSVTRMLGSESVFVIGVSKTALELGKDFFSSVACNEVVNLDDIIGEG